MDDDTTACVGLVFVLLLALAIYFLPVIVLHLRHEKHQFTPSMYGDFFMFNLLENWTVIMWFVFLWRAFKEEASERQALARRKARRQYYGRDN